MYGEKEGLEEEENGMRIREDNRDRKNVMKKDLGEDGLGEEKDLGKGEVGRDFRIEIME